MADAKKCDRCGALFEPYMGPEESMVPEHFVHVEKMRMKMNKDQLMLASIDLCSECAKSFDRWLNPKDGVNDEQ